MSAAMADPTGESKSEALRLDFDRRLMLQFRGSVNAREFRTMADRCRELHRIAFVTEEAARCWSKGACADGAAAAAWAADRAAERGLDGATFTAASAACGRAVTATFQFVPIGYVVQPITFTSQGCAAA